MTAPKKRISEMSPEEKRIAIAEACGAKWWLYDSGYTWLMSGELKDTQFNKAGRWTKSGTPKDPSKIVVGNSIPDYLNDLNAMHEAEKTFIEYPDRMTYWGQLHRLIGADDKPFHKCWYGVMTATAEQRAHAFLLTLGH